MEAPEFTKNMQDNWLELGRSPPPELLRKTHLKANNEFVDKSKTAYVSDVTLSTFIWMMLSYLRLHLYLSLKIDPANLLQLTFQKFIWMKWVGLRRRTFMVLVFKHLSMGMLVNPPRSTSRL
ncbi:uncharacterized protein LOC132043720 [Lycium ferocissimum]|uniref:uncharacterized protein LOC132043720 n=1 Tax=Lycium ferocissimum TaxID=112874 RepID=UPI0028161515|nr:uncharacterized protein LOC132043720 [Lycium ferocissimum]